MSRRIRYFSKNLGKLAILIYLSLVDMSQKSFSGELWQELAKNGENAQTKCEYAKAERFFQRSLASIGPNNNPEDNLRKCMLLARLARFYYSEEKYNKALSYAEDAEQIFALLRKKIINLNNTNIFQELAIYPGESWKGNDSDLALWVNDLRNLNILIEAYRHSSNRENAHSLLEKRLEEADRYGNNDLLKKFEGQNIYTDLLRYLE